MDLNQQKIIFIISHCYTGYFFDSCPVFVVFLGFFFKKYSMSIKNRAGKMKNFQNFELNGSLHPAQFDFFKTIV